MITKKSNNFSGIGLSLLMLLLGACASTSDIPGSPTQGRGTEVKLLMGSALGQFCQEAADRLNRQQPKLDDGTPYTMNCEAEGSGDVVTTVVSLAERFKSGSLQADSPEFPTIVSVDGEIYQSQLIYQINLLFPGQNYIPDLTDSPLLTTSPMVFMAQE